MVRDVLIDNVMSWLPGDEGVLAAGILLGGTGNLSWEMKQAFADVGLLHIVAASGYNVTVVSGWMSQVLEKWWGRKWGMVGTGAGTVGYMWLAGWSPSVVRTGVMVLLTLTALVWGRRAYAGWTLILTAGGMLIFRPDYLEDIGWQLSVAATAGLIWILPKLENIWKGGGFLSEDWRTSLAASLAVAPLLWLHFGKISWMGPVVNAALLWTVPLIMQVTAVAVGVGLVWPEGGQIIAYLAWPLLRLLTWSAEVLSGWF